MVGVVCQGRQLQAADKARSSRWGGRSVRNSGLAKVLGWTVVTHVIVVVKVAKVARQDVGSGPGCHYIKFILRLN